MKKMLALALCVVVGLLICFSDNSFSQENVQPVEKKKKVDTITTKTGLKYIEVQLGKGTLAESGNMVSVHYAGKLTNGKEFDNSFKRGNPIQFKLGTGQVIKGWDEGISGMKVGGKRVLIIPPNLGYGKTGAGNVIPPNATLIFDVELVDVE